jgi:hypothetical protein
MNLIIAAAYGYSHESILPFLTSLRERVENFHLVLLVTSDCPLTRIDDLEKDARIQLYPVQSTRMYRASRRLADRPTVARILALICHRQACLKGNWRSPRWYYLHHLTHVALARYLHARRLLATSHFQYERVLLTDIRDVVFQADPFKRTGHGLHTGLENKQVRDTTPNTWWIDRLLEDWSHIDTIRDQITICSGVTIGSREAIVDYLELMTGQILEKLPVHAFDFSEQFGFDQGIHNYILRGSHSLPMTLEENGVSDLIATLDNSNLDEFHFNEEGELCNREHIPVAIVHQYDRHEVLAKQLTAR